MTTLNSNVMAAMSDWLDLLVEKKALPCAVTQVTIDCKTEYLRANRFFLYQFLAILIFFDTQHIVDSDGV